MTKELSEFLISPKSTLRVAMSQLDKTHKKVLFVVDEKGMLVGSLSDGDLRRWILSEGLLEADVFSACFKQTFSVTEKYNVEELKAICIREKYLAIPIIDEAGKLKDILFWDHLFEDETQKLPKKNIKWPVVIMAGGFGTRLEPFTKVLPKPLIPVGDKTIIERIIDSFLKYEVGYFIISINHKSKIIKSFFEELNPEYQIEYIQETEPLGTIGCLSNLKGKLTTPILVTNCDIIIDTDYSEFVDFHVSNEYDISLVASLITHKIPYGICEIENGGNLIQLLEKPEYSFLVSTGMYIISQKVIDLIPANTTFHVTDLIEKVKNLGGKIGVFPISQSSWFDTGEWHEYKKTVERFRQ